MFGSQRGQRKSFGVVEQRSPYPAFPGKAALLVLALAVLGGCVERREFPTTTASFAVTLESLSGCGASPDAPCVHSSQLEAHRASIRALTAEGTLDTTFNGSVVLTLLPAGILEGGFLMSGGRRGTTVRLVGGLAEDLEISFSRAFGEVRLLVEDLGYTRATLVTEAACYDIYPTPGCFSRDDDDISVGTGAAGVSDPVFFTNPRIYDIQYTEVESVGEAQGWPSPLDGFRPTVDADGRDLVPTLADCVGGPQGQRELVVVTSVTVDGFYVTDVCNAAGPSFAHLYVYNFNTPENLQVGDCLRDLTGTIQEFHGFTELKNPFWQVDCDPLDPGCRLPRCADLVPAPVTLNATMMADQHHMESLEAGIVELLDATLATEFRACDLNGNGTIAGDDEWACARACGDAIDCVVAENYASYFQWTVHKDGREINVLTRGTLDFDPERHLGEHVTRITGTLRHLDFGRPPWTIAPRHEGDFEL